MWHMNFRYKVSLLLLLSLPSPLPGDILRALRGARQQQLPDFRCTADRRIFRCLSVSISRLLAIWTGMRFGVGDLGFRFGV
ncbi:hypothetical protein BZA77DRAFT_317569 [Pyronema omphalodes]|nr:hypothetical protein BZA77DRAFT_317569 [Pyronema omphalodes]